jgi:hypothetical protein
MSGRAPRGRRWISTVSRVTPAGGGSDRRSLFGVFLRLEDDDGYADAVNRRQPDALTKPGALGTRFNLRLANASRTTSGSLMLTVVTTACMCRIFPCSGSRVNENTSGDCETGPCRQLQGYRPDPRPSPRISRVGAAGPLAPV